MSAIMFFPRGGSAFATRALTESLVARGIRASVLTGSRSDMGPTADASFFYRGLDVHVVDFSPALSSHDPLSYDGPTWTAPMHPSFEARVGAPDPVFTALSSTAYQQQVNAWGRCLTAVGPPRIDVLHLHHLTPIHEAAATVMPDVPVVTHLHGTELLMLEEIETKGSSRTLSEAEWARRLRRWAQRSSSVVVAPGNVERASSLLALDPAVIATLPNGYDPTRFFPRSVEAQSTWRRILVDDPRGWRPGSLPGSVRYTEAAVSSIDGAVVLVYVGRFTAVKRLTTLLEVFGRVTRNATTEVALVVIGGYPGEWQGEHPAQAIKRLALENVFLAGWRDHEELPEILSAADLLVVPSERESFGQVIVEAMACGVPAVAGDSLGPSQIIDDGRTGWLFDVSSEAEMATTLTAAIHTPRERQRRGHAAQAVAMAAYSWPRIGEQLEWVLRAALTTTHVSEAPERSAATRRQIVE
ncbi:MAG TPA: glycosyltransferase [Solirubrobacteraceae bacterium]|nr:glycosyltransferase [Solirubrobacteraceae bacterium]